VLIIQEQRLEQQRQEMEEHARQIKLRQQQELERATSLRLSHERQQAMVSKYQYRFNVYNCCSKSSLHWFDFLWICYTTYCTQIKMPTTKTDKRA